MNDLLDCLDALATKTTPALRELTPSDAEYLRATLATEDARRDNRPCGCPDCKPVTVGEQASLYATVGLGLSVVFAPTLYGCCLFVVASVMTVGVFMQGGK